MIHSSKILVIVGSTRARRICPQIAEWVAQIGRDAVPACFEVIDLKQWPLPMDDEPVLQSTTTPLSTRSPGAGRLPRHLLSCL